MITGLFLTIFLGFLNFVFGLLPIASLNSAITSGLTSFVNYVYQYNVFFPVDTAIILIGYTALFWVLVFGFDFFKWLIHLIRGN